MRSHHQPSLPVRVLPATRPWPLHSVAATRDLESAWLSREAHGAPMRRAGLSVSRWITALAPHAQRIWIACGPGGNGGDGLHAAAVLAQRGCQVTVSLHARAADLPSDAAQGLAAAREAGAMIGSEAPSFAVDVAVDALLGIGARPEPRGTVLEGAMALGRCAARRLAIDLPTGLHPQTGVASKPGLVHAEATLALLTLHPGLFTASGRDACGEIWFDSLDAEHDAIWPSSAQACLTSTKDHPAIWLPRPHDSHKGRFGDVHVVGGARGMTGAPRLAALAAHSAGAGRTLITLLDPDAPLSDAMHPEWLWRSLEALGSTEALDSTTLVCGCGADTALDERLGDWLQRAPRIVLDADALNALSRHRGLTEELRARARRGQSSVLTPHPLEAARLLGTDTASVQADRLACAQELCDRLEATVVLKGSGTVIATPGHTTAVNATGGPSLATAGSGDVLAGWLGGLWAQAQHTDHRTPAAALAHRVACSAVWLHGSAADLQASHLPLRATELVRAMRSVPTRRQGDC